MTTRRSIAVLLIVLLSGTAAAVEDIQAEMDEPLAEIEADREFCASFISTALPPYMEQGTVMVPMRGIFEWLGAEVGYEAATQTITVHADEVDIRLRVGDRHALVNGERRAMDVPPVSVNGHTHVPLRFVSEALGAVTEWDPDEWIATINHSGREGRIQVWADRARVNIFNAAALGYTHPLRELLDAGVDVHSTCEADLTPLDYAAVGNRHDTAELLLEHGADPNAENAEGVTSLLIASMFAGPETVALLLEHGADVNAKDPGGSTALHEASLFAGPEIVALLLEHGANANAEDETGRTPLMIASVFAGPEMVALLLERGANVNAQVTAGDWEGFAALHLASMYAGPETVALLLEHGADIDAAEAEGGTPLHIASLFASSETLALLLEHGADVNAKVDGETALHGAAIAGRTDVVELLIDQGADINTRGDEGKTPLDYAVEEGYEETAELLRTHGAEE